MDFLLFLVDFIIHIDSHLEELIEAYGALTHALLFTIIFIETGIVVMPFLPGDSLLFASGAFAARGALDLRLLFPLLITAAIVGDAINYWIGTMVGTRVLTHERPWLNKRYVEQTQEFYKRHGKKTIILARFVPIVRTFAPFVAGVVQMPYRIFAFYNIVGGILWVSVFLLAGYFFGNIPLVEKHFSLVILAIIVLSITPVLREYIRALRERFARQSTMCPPHVETPKDQ